MNDINPVPAPDKPPAKRRSPFFWIFLAVALIAFCVLANWLVINIVADPFIVTGSSMEPNFHAGQTLIVNRMAYLSAPPQRGDVIFFSFPGNSTDWYFKRVIGIPGDTIEIDGERVLVNGDTLVEPYISSEPGFQSPWGRWIVPADNYFVMGDNRGHSSDSRSWGMLPKEHIIGKLWTSY